MTVLRRALILIHRYLGIALCLLFVMWFASGIAMMYSRGMPRLTSELRLERLAELDPDRIGITPAEAAERAGLAADEVGRAVLASIMERPAYRLSGRQAAVVFADDGSLLDELDATDALAVAGEFTGLSARRLTHVGLNTEPDQWTLGQRSALHKIEVDDDQATELYISAWNGEVTQMTTRGSRALAWVGAIPHWLYFRGLRTQQPLWSQIVIWASILGCIAALAGIVLGIMQLRAKPPVKLTQVESYSPYTSWWRWHHVTGLVFGVFTLTWVFSGLVSMEPFGFGTSQGRQGGGLREQFATGPGDLSQYTLPKAVALNALTQGRPIKEIEFTRLQDEPHFLVRTEQQAGHGGSGHRAHEAFFASHGGDATLLLDARTLTPRKESYSTASLLARVARAWPEANLIDATLLTEYDAYYYSRDDQAALPVLRVKLDDPESTWLYIDPRMSQLVGRLHALDRVERWLFSGLHSLDFPFWYDRRPLWDIVVILLSLGGLGLSLLGLVIGVKRLRRDLKRLTTAR